MMRPFFVSLWLFRIFRVMNLVLYCRYLLKSHDHPRKVGDVPIDDVSRFPTARELRLVSSQTGKAEKEVQSLKKLMDDSFSGRTAFVLLETGHGRHAHVEAVIAVLFQFDK